MTVKRICLASIIWMLLTTVVVFIPNVSPWIATPIVLIGIIFVLGLLWAINLKLTSDTIIDYLIYAISLGLGFLILGGLAINWVLPYLGVIHPLAPPTAHYLFRRLCADS